MSAFMRERKVKRHALCYKVCKDLEEEAEAKESVEVEISLAKSKEDEVESYSELLLVFLCSLANPDGTRAGFSL